MNDRSVGGSNTAQIVLDRLDVDSEGRLLVLDRDELDRLYQSVDAVVREDPHLRDLAEDDRLQGLLAAVSEGRGEPALAAALCTLAHDRRIGDEDPRSRYVRMVLRWQLGQALFLMAEHDEENLRRCLRLARKSLCQAEALWHAEGVSKDALFSLIFELQSWIGHRHEALGQYQAAVDAFCAAAIAARTTTQRVAYTARAALAMDDLGKVQEAYQLLLSVQDLLGDVEDEVVRSLWGGAYGHLRYKLGGDLSSHHPFEFAFFENLSEVYQKALSQGPISLDGDESLERLVEGFREMLGEIPPDDGVMRHRGMIQLAIFLSGMGRDAEAKELLQQAESLEGSFEDQLPGLERRILLARRQQHLLGDPAGAQEMFLALLPMAQRLLADEKRLQFFDYLLESLAADEGDPDCSLILDLAGRGCALFEAILNGQAGGPARRRVREVYQKFFESAVMTLLSAAYRVGEDTQSGQELLAQAWSVIMVARNPELRAVVLEPRADELRRLRELEDVFHRALRERLDWRDPLQQIHEHELANLRASRSPMQIVPAAMPPASSGVALAFFVLTDMVQPSCLVLLGWCNGQFTTQEISDAERLILTPLTAWSHRNFDSAPGTLRDLEGKVSCAVEGAKEGNEALEIGRFFFSPFTSLLSQSALPWFLFPDGALNAVPLEMLRTSEETRFGQGRAVHLCLRSSGTTTRNERVDFSRGWLGLGGVPEVPGFPYLSSSLDEVDGLVKFLHEQGHPTTVLTGSDATAAAVRAHLETHQPAVLHIAAHGSADREHPDACTLVLADDPESPERELFPFRRIRELDLSGADLVILSACRSLVGRSGRDAGMEGLAWAFIQAGAPRVIASRYGVDDAGTARFMTVLYKYLLRYPVAEALGYAREECLRLRIVPLREVAAWSVWS